MVVDFIKSKINIDLNYFVKGGFWLTLSQFLFSVKNLILSIILARLLTPDDFGLYAYLISVFMVANIFGAPGMGVAIIQSVSRGYQGTFLFLTKKVFLWSLAGSIFLLSFGIYEVVYHNLGSGIFSLFIFLALLFPFYSIGTNYVYYLVGVKKFKQRMQWETISNVVTLLMVMSSLIILKNISWIIATMLFSQTIINLIYIIILIKNANNQVDREAYGYGKKLSFSYIVPNLKMQADKIYIANLIGYSSTAIYNIANAIGDQIYTLGKVIGALTAPRSANLSAEEIQRRIKKDTLTLLGLFIIISLVVYFAVPILIPLFFSHKYDPAIIYSQVIIIFVSIKSLGAVLRSIHESQKNIKPIMISSNFISVMELVLMLAGVFYLKIWGIIIAKIISDTATTIVYLIYIFRKKN
jgi:O-antigen/teichoic acid export membrane protein